MAMFVVKVISIVILVVLMMELVLVMLLMETMPLLRPAVIISIGVMVTSRLRAWPAVGMLLVVLLVVLLGVALLVMMPLLALTMVVYLVLMMASLLLSVALTCPGCGLVPSSTSGNSNARGTTTIGVPGSRRCSASA